ncbi:hypothetical protein J2Y53_000188 [Sphingopyxis sp. BE122]|uniref:hypothetical protein n=2 Tax=unclassified Sphingopyxis TaxID=2614943 RepID=UPI002856CB84|nr:hypothetical protein [Sphingopyxis sp. BE122]MDR6831891.1 hypothetical protein [Sphingopyxis sp. BE122]
MAMKDVTMDIEPKERRAPNMLWPVAIGIGTAMLAGGFAGYNEAAAEHGDALVSAWVGPVVAILIGGLAMAFYVRRHAGWFRNWSPRKRLYWISLVLSGALGFVAAIVMQAGGAGTAGLFSNAAMTPTVAIALSAMWLVGLTVALILYHRTVDDHERHAYHLGGLAGFYAFVFPCPVWWVLWRADLAPEVQAMPLFALSLAANAIVYFWFKFR